MTSFLELNFKEITVISGGDGSKNGEIGYDIKVNGRVVSSRWGDEIREISNGGTIPLNFKVKEFGDVTVEWHAWDVDTFWDDDAGTNVQAYNVRDNHGVDINREMNLFRNGVSLRLDLSVSKGNDDTISSIQLPGRARDIGVGADGSVWIVGTNPVGTVGSARDFGIYKLSGTNWVAINGGAVRIAVGHDGAPWVVNSAGQIFKREGESWKPFPGLARDIGVGADGSVWIIGTDRVNTSGDSSIFKLTGGNWVKIDGGGVRISVAPDGMPWIVNAVGQIFHRKGASWNGPLPGRGRDIGVGRPLPDFGNSQNSSVFLIGTDRVGSGADSSIYRWAGSNWVSIPGGGIGISVAPNGVPWVVNSVGSIFRFGDV